MIDPGSSRGGCRPGNTTGSLLRPNARSQRPPTGTPAPSRSSSIGSGQTVSIRAGEIAQADILDTYGLVPGQLEVTKTIAGTLAGLQGTVVIHTACDGTPLTPDLVIPAGTPAGDQSQIYSGIPTPASCVVTETVDGHTSTVPVAVTGSPVHRQHPARRGRCRPHHRHLRFRSRLSARHQDHRRSARRPTGADRHSRGLQRHRPLAGLRDRRGVRRRAACRTASTASRPARCAPSPRPPTAAPQPSRRSSRATGRP